MSGVFSDVFAQGILDAAFGGSYTFPTDYWVGLSTTVPNSDGSNISEPVGNGYARVDLGNSEADWQSASARSKVTNIPVTFPTATGAGWGDPQAFVLFDAQTYGTFLGYGTLDAHGVVAAGITPTFSAGSLALSLPSGS